MSDQAVKPGQLNGVLVLNKPSGPSSAQCLNRIKHGLGQKKIGHAGTLDPLAQGVLLVLLGQGTKIAPYLSGGEKVYFGTMQLGLATDTYDVEGRVIEEKPPEADPEAVKSAILAWRDLTEQEVPAYSAAKHQGKPLYQLARQGREVPVKTKPIAVTEVEALEVRTPWASFRVRCSAGTYVRSLVHSLGKRLGCGAALCRLTREYSHPFGLEEAHDLDEILDTPERFGERVKPLSEALPHWPRAALDPESARSVMNGAWLPLDECPVAGVDGRPGERALFLRENGAPLALAELRAKDERIRWAILRGLWQD